MSKFLEKIKPFVQKRSEQLEEISHLEKNKIDFCAIFDNKTKNQFVVIAEIKFASPSRGKIYPGRLNCTEIAHGYIKQQASALSVLTEPHFFKGDINYIKKIRQKFSDFPILCKDFILSTKQMDHALLAGANAILLIVSFLERDQLKKLYDYATYLNLTPIIEIHDEHELNQALTLNPRIMGVNNRNLNSLDINLNISRALIKKIPETVFALCESGIQNRIDMFEMMQLGFDGFLIGTQFMHSDNPGLALQKLMSDNNYAS